MVKFGIYQLLGQMGLPVHILSSVGPQTWVAAIQNMGSCIRSRSDSKKEL